VELAADVLGRGEDPGQDARRDVVLERLVQHGGAFEEVRVPAFWAVGPVGFDMLAEGAVDRVAEPSPKPRPSAPARG
jgi:hypothetical protein